MKTLPHPIQINAHRGLTRHFPENTAISFEHAAKLPVDCIEFDVHLTSDGRLVVIHDHTIDRCSDGKGEVGRMTLAELRRHDFGRWKSPQFAGQSLLTLDQAIDLIHGINPSLKLLVEIKGRDFPCATATLDLLRRRDLLDRAVLSSFEYDILAMLRQAEPAARLHGSESTPQLHPQGVWSIADSVGVRHDVATPQRIARYKDHGLHVDVWVVNDEPVLRKAIALGADSVTSDDAALLCKLLGRMP